MKKILSLLLALALLLSLAGCQSSGVLLQNPETAPQQVTTSAPEQTGDQEPTAPYIEFVTYPTEETEPQSSDPVDPRPHPDYTQNPQPGGTDYPDDDRPRPTEPIETEPEETEPQGSWLDPNGTYTHKDDVALYIHLYGRLPNNFITKSQAKALGWKSGSLERYAPGKCIGGDRFYNKEGLLPTAVGRIYYECDIDTLGASSRGAKRIVFSNDGLVYYTSNHYKSFTLLYGVP